MHTFTPALRPILAAIMLGAAIAVVTQTTQASALELTFQTHAAFFSAESKQPQVLDPHAFVADATAPAAAGPQGIKHVAGIRPALVDRDAASVPVVTADNVPLGFTLGQWLGASGSVMIDGNNPVRLSATFRSLKPQGHYSLFENHFDQKPVGFTPMDGTGTTNNFLAKADGTATLTMTLPHLPTHDNAVLLVYHSDQTDHGVERGAIGVNAHHQIIVRIPE